MEFQFEEADESTEQNDNCSLFSLKQTNVEMQAGMLVGTNTQSSAGFHTASCPLLLFTLTYYFFWVNDGLQTFQEQISYLSDCDGNKSKACKSFCLLYFSVPRLWFPWWVMCRLLNQDLSVEGDRPQQLNRMLRSHPLQCSLPVFSIKEGMMA